MQGSLRLKAWNPAIVVLNPKNAFSSNNLLFLRRKRLTLPSCSFSLTPLQHSPSDSPPQPLPPLYTSTAVASSPPIPLSQWNLSQRHLTLLNVIACVSAICATWLFCSAIPTLLAFKRAAESLEKLMDTTREELPDTMAAIRLSGMEISDLTTELSDLGQEITQGVRSSTRAVRLAEERLRRLATMPTPPSSSASLQAMAMASRQAEADPSGGGPVVARTARVVREGIVKGRYILQMFFTISRFSRFALNYITGRR